MGLIVYCSEYSFFELINAANKHLFKNAPVSAEIVIVAKDEIKNINKNTRGQDSATDVLSFPSLENLKDKELDIKNFPHDTDGAGNIFIGSIAVCLDIAKAQAEEYGHSLEREMNYLVLHGLLHLMGYDHMSDKDKVQMRILEELIMKEAGLERI